MFITVYVDQYNWYWKIWVLLIAQNNHIRIKNRCTSCFRKAVQSLNSIWISWVKWNWKTLRIETYIPQCRAVRNKLYNLFHNSIQFFLIRSCLSIWTFNILFLKHFNLQVHMRFGMKDVTKQTLKSLINYNLK